MSEQTGGASKGPRAVIEQAPEAEGRVMPGGAGEQRADGTAASAAGAAGAAGSTGSAGGRFQDATVGFIQGVGRSAWAYADAHPHTVLYGLIGFACAALILVIGLWNTIVIAVFSGVGVAIGQAVDGESAVADFFSRLFGGRR